MIRHPPHPTPPHMARDEERKKEEGEAALIRLPLSGTCEGERCPSAGGQSVEYWCGGSISRKHPNKKTSKFGESKKIFQNIKRVGSGSFLITSISRRYGGVAQLEERMCEGTSGRWFESTRHPICFASSIRENASFAGDMGSNPMRSPKKVKLC